MVFKLKLSLSLSLSLVLHDHRKNFKLFWKSTSIEPGTPICGTILSYQAINEKGNIIFKNYNYGKINMEINMWKNL